jgi:uncharacterized protein YdaU (DUF1376 family)
MAKDPAFLFYPGDWLGGTLNFTRAHKGAYMDLLMGQFNIGHMSIEDITTILGPDFDSMWESKLKNKFIQDENGLFYNEKLENEIIKRKNFTKSRRNNLNGKDNTNSHISTHMDAHMSQHMENENENINEDSYLNDFECKKEEVLGETKSPEDIVTESPLEPLAERKSKYGGPDYTSVENVFVAKNRPKEEAAIFWNEYESKEWCVHNKEGTGRRKITNNWRYKAENWIYQAILAEVEKKKNGTRSDKTTGSNFKRIARGEVSKQDLDDGLAKAFLGERAKGIP